VGGVRGGGSQRGGVSGVESVGWSQRGGVSGGSQRGGEKEVRVSQAVSHLDARTLAVARNPHSSLFLLCARAGASAPAAPGASESSCPSTRPRQVPPCLSGTPQHTSEQQRAGRPAE